MIINRRDPAFAAAIALLIVVVVLLAIVVAIAIEPNLHSPVRRPGVFSPSYTP